MSDQTANAIVAIVVGSAMAVLLVIPVAAVVYRRQGRFSPGDLTVLLTSAIYGLSLWTYTLLPLPSSRDFACVGRQTELFGSVRPIWQRDIAGVADLLRDQVFLQVALNVVLFVPLGYYVRRVLGRGIVAAGLLGLATSALIEATQATGVWAIYRCAYRAFDVDDLWVNTLGALAGSVISLVLVRQRGRDRPLPIRVTFGRRLMGVACDGLFVVFVAVMVALARRGYVMYGPGERDPDVRAALLLGVPLALETLSVLLLSRTVGELIVDLKAVPRVRGLAWLARIAMVAFSVAPPFVLAFLLERQAAAAALAAYGLIALVGLWFTREHRGLSHLLSGMDLVIDQPGARAPFSPAAAVAAVAGDSVAGNSGASGGSGG